MISGNAKYNENSLILANKEILIKKQEVKWK